MVRYRVRPGARSLLLLLLVSGVLLVAGCLGAGNTFHFAVRNARTAPVIVQPEQAFDSVTAWTVPADDTFGWDVPRGTAVRVFSDTCALLWEGTAAGTGSPTLVFNEDGTVAVWPGVAIMNDPGPAPIQHSPCLPT
jgi:hypothetical protein